MSRTLFGGALAAYLLLTVLVISFMDLTGWQYYWLAVFTLAVYLISGLIHAHRCNRIDVPDWVNK